MRQITRRLAEPLRRAARGFPAVVLTGPRRAGKTFCLRHTFPEADYRLLEAPDVLAQVKADPRGFLDEVRLPVILDEIQNALELLPYIRARVDARPRATGRWLLTGSHDFSMMEGLSESMAGRAAVLRMLPLSVPELHEVDLLRGGFPEVWARPKVAATWFQSYLQTYLERDVRSVTQVKDLSTFRRFLGLVAARNAQLLNRTELAAPLGVSIPTVGQWLSVLETTGVVLSVPPYFENFEKRLIKSPKLYWADTGLLCHLLGITDRGALARSAFHGPVFETLVATEIAKAQLNAGGVVQLYHFRDQQGLEVDFLVPRAGGSVDLVEAKATKTITPEMARPLQTLSAALKKRPHRALIVHPGDARARTVAPGVLAVGLEAWLDEW
ncbi:MAG: ATP-binding protein [Myxococcota bacterium]